MGSKLKLGVLVLACMAFLAACSCSKGEYTVTFDSTGGSAVSSQTVAKGESVKSPADPTKEGYTFAGWYLNLSDSSTYDFSKEVTKDITLKAKWIENAKEADTYNVTFDSNGGSSVSSIVVKSGEATILPTPTRSGYKFLGWYDGETLITSSSQITTNVRLTAKWEQVQQSSTTPANNGNSGQQASTGGSGSTTPVNPKPTVNKYTVTFNANGGSASTTTISDVTEGSTITVPTASRDGYTFDGWFDANGNQLTSGTKITADVTYTASWTIIPVVETYSCVWDDYKDALMRTKVFVVDSAGNKVAGKITYVEDGVSYTDVPVTTSGKMLVRDDITSIVCSN